MLRIRIIRKRTIFPRFVKPHGEATRDTHLFATTHGEQAAGKAEKEEGEERTGRVQLMRAGRGPDQVVRRAYCFMALNWLVVPCNLSSTAMVMVLPSAETVTWATLMTFPSRLSVSSKLLSPVRFTMTLVVPGSPL
jgi:hypothetical protein